MLSGTTCGRNYFEFSSYRDYLAPGSTPYFSTFMSIGPDFDIGEVITFQVRLSGSGF